MEKCKRDYVYQDNGDVRQVNYYKLCGSLLELDILGSSWNLDLKLDIQDTSYGGLDHLERIVSNYGHVSCQGFADAAKMSSKF